MIKLARISLPTVLFGFSLFLFLGWYELRQIQEFARAEIKVDEQTFRVAVDDLVSSTSALIWNDTIRFPLLTSFTRLGKRFKYGHPADCGDASSLCAELADSFSLDVRIIQMLDDECENAKHVLILASQGDSVFLLADPLFGYVFDAGFAPSADITEIINHWEKSLREIPSEGIARYRPSCGFRFTNYTRLGLSRDHFLAEALEKQFFSFARYKNGIRLVMSVFFFAGGMFFGLKLVRR